jgi:hypothetical protein
MPCHPARARELLRKERAVVARQVPFTIRLKDRTLADSEVDGVQLRVDPGSKGTGLHLTDEKKEANDQGATVTVRRGLISVELQHRGNQISMCMQQRAGYRRRRRSANCRYRAPRYSNRTHPTGWLPPSLRHRVDTALSQATRMCRYAPVTDIHMENVSFDTHAMSAGRPLYGAEYTQGPLAGTTVRAFMKAGTRSYGFPRRCSSPRPPDAAPTHAPPPTGTDSRVYCGLAPSSTSDTSPGILYAPPCRPASGPGHGPDVSPYEPEASTVSPQEQDGSTSRTGTYDFYSGARDTATPSGLKQRRQYLQKSLERHEPAA